MGLRKGTGQGKLRQFRRIICKEEKNITDPDPSTWNEEGNGQPSSPGPELKKPTPEELLADMKAQIEAEWAKIQALKEQGADVEAALRAEANARWEETEEIEIQIEGAKDQASSRKDEISEWKLWYNGLAEIDKTESMKKLEFEVGWRSKDIGEIEKKIVELQKSLLAAKGRLETARQMLAAFEAGVYEGSMVEDPRLKVD